MKIKIKILFILVASLLYTENIYSQNKDSKDIVQKAHDLLQGESNYAEVTMTIERPKWTRTLRFKSWMKGAEYAMIYITEPAKEKGQVFLKRKDEMWNWIPSIDRMIKIPPSMMMQSWMGSDFTNDDLVQESSLVKDYDHKMMGEEKVEGFNCYKIELIPHEDAPVVWGKIYTWISKNEYYTLKNEYYDEDNELVNVETLSKIRDVGDRSIPTKFVLKPVDKEGHKTTMEFKEIKFGIDIKESFFSIQNMKKVR